MIEYNIRKYTDNSEENFLQIEIIKPNQFNNDIINIDETYDSLFEIYILLLLKIRLFQVFKFD